MKKWLIVDVHYLCHRAFHSTRNLSHAEKPTGVIFGFLKSIITLKDDFLTDRIAFCFESRSLYRSDIYPEYKQKRHAKRTPEEVEAMQALTVQIQELQHRYLPRIGFKNIFSYKGMESDDTMAAIAQEYGDENEIILVTADADLLQCLRQGVSMWNPSKQHLHTHVGFEAAYGIRPAQWAIVKAMAGCTSDGVKGIDRIGDVSALKYLRGELKPESAAYKKIMSAEGRAIVRRNRKLVELPFKGCPVPELLEDNVTKSGWLEVCDMLGLRSIAKHPPILTRKRMNHGK